MPALEHPRGTSAMRSCAYLFIRIVVGRVRQPCHRATWKRLELAQVGLSLGARVGSRLRRRAVVAGSLRTVLCSDGLKLEDGFTRWDDPAFRGLHTGLGPQRGRSKTGNIDFSIGPQPAQSRRLIQSAYRNTVGNNMRRNRNEENQRRKTKRGIDVNDLLIETQFASTTDPKFGLQLRSNVRVATTRPEPAI
jgi:hypothetical protein